MATRKQLSEASHAQAEAFHAAHQARMNGQPRDFAAYLREHPLPPVTLEELVRHSYEMGWEGVPKLLRANADIFEVSGEHELAEELRRQAEAL